MSIFTLKLLACFLMLVDHAGVILFDNAGWMRAVGRLALPLFAFILVEGFVKTSNLAGYMGRLFVLALLSQPIYTMAFAEYPSGDLNICFTLTLALVVLQFYQDTDNLWVIFLGMAAAEVGNLSYGGSAILLVFVLYRFRNSRPQMLLYLWLPILYMMLEKIGKTLWLHPEIQDVSGYLALAPRTFLYPLAWLAVIFIFFYNQEQGPRLKYFFYFFYPGHLIILLLIKHWATLLQLVS